MTPNLRKNRTLTEKGISFASESNTMPPRAGEPGVADDQGSTGQGRSPSEDNQPSAELDLDEDHTEMHANDADGENFVDAAADYPPPEPLRRRAGTRNVNNPIPNLDPDTISFLSNLMSQSTMNRSKERDITRGAVPKWNHGKEPFIAFEQELTLWIESHGLEHLLKILQVCPNLRK